MKGLVFDIKHYAIHDGPGIRTTVFLKGCPMACLWCHNPESQKPEPETIIRENKLDGKIYKTKEIIGKEMSTQQVMDEISKDKVYYEESGGGVTFSGGEPLVQSTFLIDVLSACKEEGYHTALDTSGHANGNIVGDVINLTDLFLYDLKFMDDFAHQKYTGVSNQLSLSNLDKLVEAEKEIIIRFPVIPGITDVADNISMISDHMASRGLDRIDLLRYHSMAQNKYEQLGRIYELDGIDKLTDERLEEIRGVFEKKGLVVGD